MNKFIRDMIIKSKFYFLIHIILIVSCIIWFIQIKGRQNVFADINCDFINLFMTAELSKTIESSSKSFVSEHFHVTKFVVLLIFFLSLYYSTHKIPLVKYAVPIKKNFFRPPPG